MYLLLPLVLLFTPATRGQFGISDIRDRILETFQGRDRAQESLFRAIEEAIEEAKSSQPTRRYGINDVYTSEPLVAHARNMEATEGAAKIGDVSAVLLRVTQILRDRFGQDIIPELREIDVMRFIKFPSTSRNCDSFMKYRTFDGTCNNLEDPTFGSRYHILRRLLPPKYEDGLSIPRSFSVTGSPLPSPRLISNEIHGVNPARSPKFSLLLMQFGQLLDHEITHSPVVQTEFGGNLNCSRCDSPKTVSRACFPIPVPEDDPRFSGCIPFVRSLPGQRRFGPREQMNQVTSFLDGSVFYGSSKGVSDSLRTFKGGKLRATAGGSHLGMLLPIDDDQSECKSGPDFPCFVSGDKRSSQQPMLQSLHVIFHRHHNSLAEGLARVRPDWNDETVFQETRRIISAQFNHIVYNEFLPKVLGEAAMSKYNLNLNGISGHSQDYDSHCDASISQSFATAAFRFGHSMIARLYPLLNGQMQNISAPMDLTDNFNNMEQIYNERSGGVDSLLMGMAASSSMEFDPHVSTVVRNHLFAQRGQPKSGLDLAAINIQRGRDHGVASYNDHRELCGLQKAMSFSSLLAEMDFETAAIIEKIYAHVDDIDLFTGLLAERTEHDAIVGPTTICLLAEQFSRLKRCDRYFYDQEGPGGFTPGQLAELRKTTFAGIICANSRLPQLQSQVFDLPDEFLNSPVPCHSFPQLDLSLWA